MQFFRQQRFFVQHIINILQGIAVTLFQGRLIRVRRLTALYKADQSAPVEINLHPETGRKFPFIQITECLIQAPDGVLDPQIDNIHDVIILP